MAALRSRKKEDRIILSGYIGSVRKEDLNCYEKKEHRTSDSKMKKILRKNLQGV